MHIDPEREQEAKPLWSNRGRLLLEPSSNSFCFYCLVSIWKGSHAEYKACVEAIYRGLVIKYCFLFWLFLLLFSSVFVPTFRCSSIGCSKDCCNLCTKGFYCHQESCCTWIDSLHSFWSSGLCLNVFGWISFFQSYIPIKWTRHLETDGDVVYLDV